MSPSTKLLESAAFRTALIVMTWLSLCALPATSVEPTSGAQAELQFPLGLALGPGGALYVSERRAHVVRRWDPETDQMTMVAGTGEAGFSGDGGPATEAQIACPDSITMDAAGHLYLADRCNERIRRVDAETGVITTVAGTGERGPAPDGPALETALTGPFFVRVESAESLLFTDTDAHLVRRLDLASGRITTLAGSGEGGFAGDGGMALAASFSRPHVAVRLSSGDLLIGDSGNQRLRLIDGETGIIETIAGSGEEGAASDGSPALEAAFYYFGDIRELPGGDLLIPEWVNGRVLRLDRFEGVVRVVAGTVDESASAVDGRDPLETQLGRISGMALDEQGRIYTVDAEGGRVRRIDLEKRIVETVIGPAP